MDSAPETVFQERLARWRELHLHQGPACSYPHAWRLPELARNLGADARTAAWRAHALDLCTLGRCAEALAVMDRAPPEAAAALAHLRTGCAILLGRPQVEGDRLEASERAFLAHLADDPDAALDALTALGPSLWNTLLAFWARARRGQEAGLVPAHRAAAQLRATAPTLGARAEALLAEGLYHLGPRWAVPWLDHALDCCETYSQHDLRPRLTRLKSEALAAAGDLGAAMRCEKVLKDLVRRLERSHSL